VSGLKSDPKLEKFLAILYTDDDARARFLASPKEEARRAGLDEAQCEALESVDRVGLHMASRSFARKRELKKKK
jgi:hypothetical protein